MPSIIDTEPDLTGKELIILDPVEVATGRDELSLHSGPLMVAPSGPDWGTAQIEQYLAEAVRGQVPIDFRIPNRVIEIPLLLRTVRGGVTFDEARIWLQQKVGLFHREGGWLKRQMRDGRVLFLDVVNATLKMGGSTSAALYDIDADCVLTLEAIPDFYGEEIDLGSAETDAGAGELVFLVDGVQGDHPARVRVIATDEAGETQLSLVGGFRCRHYSADPTARLAYDAQDLTPLDAAVLDTLAGSIAASVVEHAALSTQWTPVLSTEIDGVGHLTHTGSYQVLARCYSTTATPPSLRLVWDVGDLVLPEENSQWQLPAAGAFYIADLGQVRLDEIPVGDHRWQGVIQARGDVGGENITIDRVWLQPIDEAAWKLSASADSSPGLSDYVARDEFNQAPGDLTGETLPVGGTWAGAGDADDFQLVPTISGASLERDTDTDGGSGALSGRYAFATPDADRIAVQVEMSTSARDDFNQQIVLARYVDDSNFAYVTMESYETQDDVHLRAFVVVADVFTLVIPLAQVPADPTTAAVGVRFVVLETGVCQMWTSVNGGAYQLQGVGQHAALATGGALESGKVGFLDAATTTTPGITRTYDNFAAWVPAVDAVLHANQSCEMRWDGMFREDVTGAAGGPVRRRGDLPRLPPSGMEDRLIEVFLKASRGDLDEIPDSGVDALSAQVLYRPSWLFVPDQAAASS